MFDRRVGYLADKADGDLLRAGAGARATDCVPVTAWWKMRAGGCITEVADLPYVGVGCRKFLPRGAAISSPSRSQWQTRRMRPGAVVHNFPRHKKWASQVGPSEKSHCNACRDMNGGS